MAPSQPFPWRPGIEQAALTSALDPDLLHAVVLQESAGDQAAWNPEPRYRYFWNVRTAAPFRVVSSAEVASKFPPKDFPTLAGDADQEWWGQQASWGLMQIMGAVAREHGYHGSYLTRLVLDPGANLLLGARHLAKLLAWARTYTLEGENTTAVRSALAAYNGGKVGNAPSAAMLRNGEYARQVLVRYDKLRSA